MKWFSDTISRFTSGVFSTLVAGAVLVSMAAPFSGYTRLNALEGKLHPIRPIDIRDDGGGVIPEFEEWYQRIRDSGVPVRISGECDSSCTLVLMLPKTQVCVEDGAVLGFHLARASLAAKEGDPKITDMVIRRYYPQVVQDWLAKQPPLTLDMTYMMSSEIVALGIFPHC